MEYYQRELFFLAGETRDVSNYRLVNGGWAESSGHEGDFIGIIQKNMNGELAPMKLSLSLWRLTK